MSDFTITTDDELMVTHIEGTTEAGTDFIDGYLASNLVVVDSGRIILRQDDVDDFVRAAGEQGLAPEPKEES